jgi:uncharacterized membrane protein
VNGSSSRAVVALDLPSGLNHVTGRGYAPTMRASHTLVRVIITTIKMIIIMMIIIIITITIVIIIIINVVMQVKIEEFYTCKSTIGTH